jgi:hypothetical protein
MWRFVLAGMITVSGVVLLFVASFGDPSTALRDVRALLPVVQAPAVTTAAAPASPKPATAPSQAPAAAAPPSTPAPDMAALERQRNELQGQLHDLQAKAAMASGDADAARRELDSLRERRAADQAASEQSRQEAQREIEASQQRASEAEKRMAAEKAALDQLRAETERAQAQARAEPPKDVKPAQDTKPAHVAEAAPSPPPQHPPASAAPAPKPAPPPAKPAPAARVEQSPPPRNLAANTPPAPKPVPPTAKRPEPDSNSPEAVLNKLRHTPGARGQVEQEASGDHAPVAPPEQRAALPRERLLNARAALTAGRIDEARRLLEQSQVQLVLRSSDPSGPSAAANSVAAGQIAEALSMLGAGDVPRAMRYIDLAVPQVGNGRSGGLQAVTTVPRSREGEEAAGYGYRDDYPPDFRYGPTLRQ